MVGRKRVSDGQKPQHLQPQQDHDRAGDKREDAIDFRRERQRRAQRADGAAEQRVGEDAPGVEIDVRFHALDRRESGARFRVFGSDRDQQPAGNGDARRHRGDQADDEYEAVAHRLGHAELPGQQVELAEPQEEGDDDQERRADFDVIARRVLRRVKMGHGLTP